jgi:hypothetical protein
MNPSSRLVQDVTESFSRPWDSFCLVPAPGIPGAVLRLSRQPYFCGEGKPQRCAGLDERHGDGWHGDHVPAFKGLPLAESQGAACW